jgi:hypothetical protein|tara:strand:- start:59 stop:301 length:243 start_codon:yes stop_codon:yes gene_type:complete
MRIKTNFLKFISDLLTPVSIFPKIRDAYNKVFILESSDLVTYLYKEYIIVYKESLVNYIDVVFHIFSNLNLFGRAPPTQI